jgi:hypothetical protein
LTFRLPLWTSYYFIFLLFIIILLSVCFHLQTSEYAFSLMKPEGFIYNDEVKVSIT